MISKKGNRNIHFNRLLFISFLFCVFIVSLSSAYAWTATLHVTKTVDGVPAQNWEFTPYVIGGLSAPISMLTDVSGQATFVIMIDNVSATFDIVETLQNNYWLDDAYCINQNQVPIGAFDNLNSVDGITVVEDDNIYCTFENIADAQCPLVEVINPPATNPVTWYNDGIMIQATVSDFNSGVYNVRTRLHDQTVTWLDGPHNMTYNGGNGFFEYFWDSEQEGVPACGFVLVDVFGEDNAGNGRQNECADVNQFGIDNAPPVTTKTIGYPSYGENGYYVNTSTPLTLNAADCGIGVDYIHYELWWDSTGDGIVDVITEENDVYDDNVTVSFDEESFHQIRWYAVDELGNIELEHIQDHAVDETEPSITKEVGEPKVACGEGEICDYYVTQNTPITLTCEDPLPHPVDNVALYWRTYLTSSTPGEWNQAEGNSAIIHYGGDSEHALDWYCVDALGNSNGTAEIPYHEVDIVETQAPVINKQLIGSQVPTQFLCGEDFNYGCYYITQSTLINVTAYDPQPHPVNDVEVWCEYQITDQQPIVYHEPWLVTQPFNFPEDSQHQLHCWAEDALGNKAHLYELDFVDTQAPITQKLVSNPKYAPDLEALNNGISLWTPEDSSTGTYSAKLVIPNNPSSGDFAGVDSFFDVFVELNSINSLTYDRKVTQFNFGTPNRGWSPIVVFGVDADSDGIYEAHPLEWQANGFNPIYLGDDTFIQCEATSALTDFDSEFVNVDAYNTFSCYTPNLAGNGYDAYNILSYFQNNNVGRVETTDEVAMIKVELGGNPTTQDNEVAYVDNVMLNGNLIIGEPVNSELWITQNTLVTLQCKDSEPHPVNDVSLFYRTSLDGLFGEWTEALEGYQEIQFNEDSNHTIEWYCVDALGNREETKYEVDNVDSAGPKIEKWVSDTTVMPGDQVQICANVTDVKLTQDPGVGVDESSILSVLTLGEDPQHVELEHQEGDTYCGYWTAPPINEYCQEFRCLWNVEVQASDLLGNDEHENGVQIIVDNAKPKVNYVLNPPSGRYYRDGKLFSIYAPAIDFGGDPNIYNWDLCRASGVYECRWYAVDYPFEDVSQEEVKNYWDYLNELGDVFNNPSVVNLGSTPYVDGVCRGIVQIPEESGLTDKAFLAYQIEDNAGNVKGDEDTLAKDFDGDHILLDIDNEGPGVLVTDLGNTDSPKTSGDIITLQAEIIEYESGFDECWADLYTCGSYEDEEYEYEECTDTGINLEGTGLNDNLCEINDVLPNVLPSGQPLQSGYYELKVNARDELFNIGSDWAGLEIDNLRPTMSVVSPSEGGVYGAMLPVSLHVEDNTEVAEETVKFKLTEIPAVGNLFCVFGTCEETDWLTLPYVYDDLYAGEFDILEEGITGEGRYVLDAVACDPFYIPEPETELGFSLGNSRTDMHCRMISEHGNVEEEDLSQCADGLDNDHDELIDLSDYGCEDSEDDDELNIEE